MKTICAWCGELIKKGEKIVETEKEPISHGMCSECEKKVRQENGLPQRFEKEGQEE